jgi:HmuY protein
MHRLVPSAAALLLSFAAAFALGACGTPQPQCGPTTCEGCCDSAGTCRRGDSDPACGFSGVACNVCSAIQTCSGYVCVIVGQGGTDGGSDGGSDGGNDAGTPICGRTPVDCSDQAIAQLDLKLTPAPGLISNTPLDGGFLSVIDATAGGSPPTAGYVYGTFTAAGLTRVALQDQAALDALDWDIAFRRFVIRLNGGDSGPACTGAVALPQGTAFDAVTQPPAAAPFAVDDFLSGAPNCTFQDDGSGLTTSPATALANSGASFYAYTSCVQMTGRVFVVRTRFGRHLKLEVTGYYSTEVAQQNCNQGLSPGAPGGTIRVRWAWLD